MFLYIARHAWAGQRGDPRWADDSKRELTPEGIERFSNMVKTLVGRGFRPERIATSPYTRCRQTADLIARHLDSKLKVEELAALEPGSQLQPLVEWTNSQGGRDVCWVGHSPDVEELTAALIGDGQACLRFAKGGMAAIRFDEQVVVGEGVLYWLATAKLLGR